MSAAASVSTLSLGQALSPVAGRVRAYFAPVGRTPGGVANVPTTFDPSVNGGFAAGAPPAPWMDLGWISRFVRTTGTTLEEVLSGAPAVAGTQVRSEIGAAVSLDFESWGKLQLAIASGSQQMNLLAPVSGAAMNGSGGVAQAGVAVGAGSTAATLNVGAAAGFAVGQLVAVDVDYTGQVGYVGSGVAGAYVRSSAVVSNDVSYIRRISLNVGRIASVGAGVITLAAPLLAGVPTAAMRVSVLNGFVDREGGSFFQEWSGLFVLDGMQGDRVIFYYPRLQAMRGSSEVFEALGQVSGSGQAGVAGLERVRLAGAFRALPVRDANDGEMVVCYRSYLPAV